MPSLYDKMLQKTVKESQTIPTRKEDRLTSANVSPLPDSDVTKVDQKFTPLTPLSFSESNDTEQQENKKTSFLANKESVKQVKQETSKRSMYPKVTYQLNPQVTEMLEDTKRTLKRQYNIKATLADIVEEAIQRASNDLLVNKETSFLVYKLKSNQESK